MSWLCHRTCRHCYEQRFRPYHGEELDTVVHQARGNSPAIMTYRAPESKATRRGQVILAGGEILLEPTEVR